MVDAVVVRHQPIHSTIFAQGSASLCSVDAWRNTFLVRGEAKHGVTMALDPVAVISRLFSANETDIGSART
jgi:hypothetical protein